MKNILILLGIFSFSITVKGQYKIDLEQNNQPKIERITLGDSGPHGKEIEINNLYMTIGDKSVLPVMGEFHYSRYDYRFWKDALMKMKASGVNIVSVYVLWNYHEEIEGRLDWFENNNLKEFVKLCKDLDLLVHLRCGPYCNAEARNGGIPDWLKSKTKVRSNDPLYLAYTRKWYKDVYSQIKGQLYKDGGPIIGLQLENEFVTEGMVVSHIMNLKKIAVSEGWDVPIYSMTHWMSSEYPKGEVVPYAGYYIETPWINSGKKELPISNFQFFNYNRISDNIGTDIITKTGNTESLVADDSSPYFTCEVGVGTPSFYYRRPIVPKEMAGANINLRLGCGVNLMGYYMYTGGTNRVGQLTTLESSTGRMSYDYQAPVREFGNLGESMKETKKFNYLMNDFGDRLATAIAYLPESNKDTTNLQWAVRLNEKDGFLFCSNYLYKHSRKDYRNVQFDLKLKGETLQIPSKPITITDQTYFVWPLNQKLSGINLKYATTQPITKHEQGDITTYFFAKSKDIQSEYLIDAENIAKIKSSSGKVSKKGNQYLINSLTVGKDCIIEIQDKKGKFVRLVTLTEEESHCIWKGKVRGQDFVAFTKSSLIYDESGISLMDETAQQWIDIYESQFVAQHGVKSKLYTNYRLEEPVVNRSVRFRKMLPMEGSKWIKPSENNVVEKIFDGITLSSIDNMILRAKIDGNAKCFFNGVEINMKDDGNYVEADLSNHFINGKNILRFDSDHSFSVIAEAEVNLKNGTRWLWQTDRTWTSDGNLPTEELESKENIAWNEKEKYKFYTIETPPLYDYSQEVRLNIDFSGDRADAFIGTNLINDKLFDGEDWIIGINRYNTELLTNPLIIRVKGLISENEPIYFEKGTDLTNCTKPQINRVNVKNEYRFKIN